MKISVITVSYNSEKTIADTLRSVATQSYKDIEHLIIDGQSTDQTLCLIEKYRHPSLILNSDADQGIYDAMNKGISLAIGDVVGFLNSDDFYADAFVLEKIARTFKDPSVDACFGDLVYVSQDNRKLIRYWKSKDFFSGDFAKGWCPAHPTFYIRRSKIAEFGIFDLSYKYAADVEFMMRYLEHGKLNAVYIPYTLVRMRIGGVSNQSWKNIIKQNKEIFLALTKNGVQFSRVIFFIYKLMNRLWQFVAALYRNIYKSHL